MRGSTGIQKITCDGEAMPLDDIALSKTIAHALRHAPWLYELELDGEGWVPLDSLVHLGGSSDPHNQTVRGFPW